MWVKAVEEGLRADNVSLANLSWEVALVEALFRNGPRADCVSLANLSEVWATAEQDLRADCASLAILSLVLVEDSAGTRRGTTVGDSGSCGRGNSSDMRRKQSVWSNGKV